MSRRNNLSYSAHTPTFLRRLRGELPPEPSAATKYSDQASVDNAKDVVSDDETTVPEYIFKGETITKGEFEELQKGKNIDDIKADRLRRENEEKELVQAPDQTASSKPSANVSEFGSRAAKRKYPGKIKQTDATDEENHEVATAAKRNKSVPDVKKKVTKDERKTNAEKKKSDRKVSRVQLSFGDDDE
ncbi:hypothetical protein V1517DRAFT_337906 [Lipomyces orientalis]|uniref:Uncharacterized protein n=1 Tax=Lipomyces orientalis TaxID=1233043 RepID=A0ACC3TQG5_9ASCO